MVVDAEEMVFSVSRGLFKELVNSASTLAGTTRLDEIAYALRFPGVLLSKVDAASLLGALRFKDGDVIYRVDKVTTPTVKALNAALKASSSRSAAAPIKITYIRKDIFYSAYIQLVDSAAGVAK